MTQYRSVSSRNSPGNLLLQIVLVLPQPSKFLCMNLVLKTIKNIFHDIFMGKSFKIFAPTNRKLNVDLHYNICICY